MTDEEKNTENTEDAENIEDDEETSTIESSENEEVPAAEDGSPEIVDNTDVEGSEPASGENGGEPEISLIEFKNDESGSSEGENSAAEEASSEEPERVDAKKTLTEESLGNIKRLQRIRKKRELQVPVRAMGMAVGAVAIVAVIAVIVGIVGNIRESADETLKVETVAASLETTAPPETTTEADAEYIVLETTLSAEQIAEIEWNEQVESVLDGYANLGIAAVSGYLNVREEPEAYGEVIGKLEGGAACEVVDTSVDGWYKISSGGVTGYVSSQYILTGDAAKEAARDNVQERAVVDAVKLNIREAPDTEAPVVGQALLDERYIIRGTTGDWIQIDNGYISADYVTVKYALNEARQQDMRTTVLTMYDNLGVSNVDSYLNVRDKPSETDGTIIAKLPGNAGCDILEETDDGWYLVRSGKITGYVKSEYILTGTAAEEKAMDVAQLMAYTITDGVNVRTEPNTSSSIWTQLSDNEHYLVVSQMDGWVEIELDDVNAYVSSDLVNVRYGLDEAIRYTPVVETKDTSSSSSSSSKSSSSSSSSSSSKSSSSSSSSGSSGSSSVNSGAAGSNAGPVSSTRAQIANYAVQFVGNPYVWGGTSLTNGADCSGFTMSVMSHFGVSLPHSSAAQANCGRAVSSSEMRPGDLVCYGGSGGVNHVALYIGNGQVVHASSASTGIKISSWNYRTPATIRNVLGD